MIIFEQNAERSSLIQYWPSRFERVNRNKAFLHCVVESDFLFFSSFLNKNLLFLNKIFGLRWHTALKITLENELCYCANGWESLCRTTVLWFFLEKKGKRKLTYIYQLQTSKKDIFFLFYFRQNVHLLSLILHRKNNKNLMVCTFLWTKTCQNTI